VPCGSCPPSHQTRAFESPCPLHPLIPPSLGFLRSQPACVSVAADPLSAERVPPPHLSPRTPNSPTCPTCFVATHQQTAAPQNIAHEVFVPLVPAAMEQWQAYNDPSNASGQRRYNGNNNLGQMSPRDFGSGGPAPAQQAQQPPAGFKYDQYQGGLNPHQTSASSATSPMASPQVRDGNGDVPMQDAHDSYAGLNSSVKYPMRPHHQHHLSTGRTATLQQEPSAAAQRYSPMEVLSPTSPYGAKSAGPAQFPQQPAQQRQSPTRSSDYAPQQSPYYSSRQAAPQLPPIHPYATGQETYSPSGVNSIDGSYMDPKSPKRAPTQSAMPPADRGPVPEFKRIRGPTDLKPKVNTQPAFRRANPEGGFISVSKRSQRTS
jgi:dual specificity protein kinase YAK1